jgi:hypothetical protein
MSAVRVIGTVPPLTTFDYPSASDSRRPTIIVPVGARVFEGSY